jgi:TfoX/Sxy family transcriptional regulator of competence genes
MAFNEELAERVLREFRFISGFEERRMFGGVGCLIHGNMACGVLNDELIVRVGPDSYLECLALPHVREFDLTGRSMKGWVMVGPEGTVTPNELKTWARRGMEFAASLPPKT